MNSVCCIILAAGAGKRMKSEKPKVLSEVLFKPMIKWVIDMVKSVGIDDICVVSGFKRNLLVDYLDNEQIKYKEAFQKEQKGTAHAVNSAAEFLNDHKGYDVIVLNGDAPLIDEDTVKKALYVHRKYSASSTVITSKIDNPSGYGRIIRDKDTDRFKAIVEHKDATTEQLKINEVNSGAYWFKVDDLIEALKMVQNNNSQGEYYLTDTLEILLKNGRSVEPYLTSNPDVILGANNVAQLSQLNEIARNRVIDKLLEYGVNIPCKDGVVISPDVQIGENSTILPSTIIKGKTIVGKACILGPNSVIINSRVGSDVSLECVYCSNYTFRSGEEVSPMSKYIS
ncbi:MAG: sugar phosphate nucleotidyltransferase [Clostridia bacterium]|nr:sugar phosphate nucleotidyltransferase [Clostridia bacterium]